jgi:hypothetical protein
MLANSALSGQSARKGRAQHGHTGINDDMRSRIFQRIQVWKEATQHMILDWRPRTSDDNCNIHDSGFQIKYEQNKISGDKLNVTIDHEQNPRYNIFGIWDLMKSSVKNVQKFLYDEGKRMDYDVKPGFRIIEVCKDHPGGIGCEICFWVVPQKTRSIVICARKNIGETRKQANLMTINVGYDEKKAPVSIPYHEILYGFISKHPDLQRLSKYIKEKIIPAANMTHTNTDIFPQPMASFCCAKCGKAVQYLC